MNINPEIKKILQSIDENGDLNQKILKEAQQRQEMLAKPTAPLELWKTYPFSLQPLRARSKTTQAVRQLSL